MINPDFIYPGFINEVKGALNRGGASDGDVSELETTFISVLDGTAVNPVLPSGLTSIRAYAFYNWSRLELTSLPSGVTNIGNYAFEDCRKLALTSLPSGVTIIGTYAFSGCSNLALTSLPSGVTTIGTRAFEDCTGLTELTFEGTPKTIDSNAFRDCDNLKTINAPWAEGAVAGSPWGATNATINYNYTGG